MLNDRRMSILVARGCDPRIVRQYSSGDCPAREMHRIHSLLHLLQSRFSPDTRHADRTRTRNRTSSSRNDERYGRYRYAVPRDRSAQSADKRSSVGSCVLAGQQRGMERISWLGMSCSNLSLFYCLPRISRLNRCWRGSREGRESQLTFRVPNIEFRNLSCSLFFQTCLKRSIFVGMASG